jgi:cobalamin biosynthesis Mg chelatase CobN
MRPPGRTPHPVLQRMRQVLRPRLDACGPQEIAQCLRGLSGKFVPAGPSGAPSRGRPDVLPTGRNFYSVDTRAVPTQTAYAMGAAAAERVVERHLQDHGEMLRCLGLSVWGTSTMRTGGEDIAQAFALLGVRPKWADGSSRVVDIEVLPMAIRNRPRVDVTLRVSGFFRDAFPNVIDLFDTAVRAVAAISEEDEPDEVNPIRARVRREAQEAQARGLSAEAAQREATWRVFGPRPGGYGAGLQEVMASGRWNDGADLAQAYLRAGAFAYGQGEHGAAARGSFEQRLAGLDAVLHNQDNREHDVLDSDDYYQFQGGMAVAVSSWRARPPRSTTAISACPARRAYAPWARKWRAWCVRAPSTPSGWRACAATATRARSRWPPRWTTCSPLTPPPAWWATTSTRWWPRPTCTTTPTARFCSGTTPARCAASASACSKPCGAACGRRRASTANALKSICWRWSAGLKNTEKDPWHEQP